MDFGSVGNVNMSLSFSPRGKWMRVRPNIKVGDLVLVVESTPRHEWPLARVIEIFPDVKGHVRRIKLINARHREFERHVTGVVPLEVVDDDSDNDNNKDK